MTRSIPSQGLTVLDYVQAPDLETATAEAIKQFEITNPEQQRRLIARRTD